MFFMHVFILENLFIILALLFLYLVENALCFGDIAILYCKMTAVGSARKFNKLIRHLDIIFYIFIWFYVTSAVSFNKYIGKDRQISCLAIKSLVSCIDD
ncbi:hypothetical protein T01_1448 [Trichinella spiralis]|uniref:Uncharacterized protein n=1 Tax=Trichinella spiralis TaxID=6334 RepID=A0A0V1AT10_TRISP|nr:hypothetical protein T01_1448 [Trichinella spiralis]